MAAVNDRLPPDDDDDDDGRTQSWCQADSGFSVSVFVGQAKPPYDGALGAAAVTERRKHVLSYISRCRCRLDDMPMVWMLKAPKDLLAVRCCCCCYLRRVVM